MSDDKSETKAFTGSQKPPAVPTDQRPRPPLVTGDPPRGHESSAKPPSGPVDQVEPPPPQQPPTNKKD
jgi:hypothetical protein